IAAMTALVNALNDPARGITRSTGRMDRSPGTWPSFVLKIGVRWPATGTVLAASLNGKSIVIIGGTTGLGLSAAQAFVESGASVIIVGRDKDNAERALLKLGEKRARSVVGDA